MFKIKMKNEKLKETLRYLKTENAQFQKYNQLLNSTISQISNSNEKLLNSFNEKCLFLTKLAKDNNFIEESSQTKLTEVKNYDFINWKIISNQDLSLSENLICNDANQAVDRNIELTKNDSANQTSNSVSDTNTNLQNELNELISIFGENELFSQYQKISNECLKLRHELHQLSQQGFLSNTKDVPAFTEFQGESPITMLLTPIAGQIKRKMSVTVRPNFPLSFEKKQNDIYSHQMNDFQSSESHSSIHKDFMVEKSGHNKLSRSCQTVENINSSEIGQKLSEQSNQQILNRQLRKIEHKKTKISEINSQIEKLKMELNNQQYVKQRSISCNIEKVCELDIFDVKEYHAIAIETETQVQFEKIKAKFDETNMQSFEAFKKAYEKYHLKMICDQKDIELRMQQLSKDRKTANYKSLLRQLKTINPVSYSKELGNATQSNPKIQKKKEYFHHQIKKYKMKIQQLREQSNSIQNQEKEINLRIEFLQREIIFFQNPQEYIKTYLAKLCQKVALNQEEIRDILRDIALTKLESEFVDRVKTRMYENVSKNSDLLENIYQMDEKLKSMKYKYSFSDMKDERNVTTKPEIDYLQHKLDQLVKEIEQINKNIAAIISQLTPIIGKLKQAQILIPAIHTSLLNINTPLLCSK